MNEYQDDNRGPFTRVKEGMLLTLPLGLVLLLSELMNFGAGDENALSTTGPAAVGVKDEDDPLMALEAQILCEEMEKRLTQAREEEGQEIEELLHNLLDQAGGLFDEEAEEGELEEAVSYMEATLVINDEQAEMLLRWLNRVYLKTRAADGAFDDITPGEGQSLFGAGDDELSQMFQEDTEAPVGHSMLASVLGWLVSELSDEL